MSRPTQEKLKEALSNIMSACEQLTMPFNIAVGLGQDFRYAERAAEDLNKFVKLSNSAFEALEGLLANWPTTDAALKYQPDPHRPVLMKDKAIDQAADVLKKYREIEGEFTW